MEPAILPLSKANSGRVTLHPLRPKIAGAAAACLLWIVTSHAASGQTIALHFDPAQTSAHFALPATLHTVHGEFAFKHGEISFDPASGQLSGEIVFDATRGQSGNQSRDRTMQKDVLESERYPEITFQPDRVNGKVQPMSVSAVEVHGVFRIHGTAHELTVPVEVRLDPQRWTATTHFSIPYVAWGMKRPSAPFVRVAESVVVEFHGAGSLLRPAP